MKKLSALALAALIATPGFAGTLVDPIVEADVIVEEAATSSSAGLLIPLLLIIIIGAALINGGGESKPSIGPPDIPDFL